MPERKWVVNASPIISLSDIGYISLLNALCDQLVIPSGVAQEINAGPDDDPARRWLNERRKKSIQEAGTIHPIIAAWDLGKGETEVLNWAYANRDYVAVIDDRAARNCALSLDIRVTGTVGIIVIAKQQRKIQAAGPLLDHLVQTGFRLSGQLRRVALELAGESTA